MQEHPYAPQLRSPGDGRGGPRAALQYVRKVSGSNKPSHANAEAFDRAVEEVAAATKRLLEGLTTSAPPKDREVEAAKRQGAGRRPFRRLTGRAWTQPHG